MAFSSVTFLFFFLPLFMGVYFLTPTTRARNLVALLCSLLFYAWGEPKLVVVLLGAIAFNASAAVIIDACSGRPRSAALTVALGANLLNLGAFKYASFVVLNLNAVLVGLGLAIPVPDLPLPLGISFFTFHCMSYVIDVYRRRFAANRNPVEVALYIALFPQLVAGPIVRYRTVARQLRARRHRLTYASAGMRIFVIGLAQKVLIADQVAPLVDVVFDHTRMPSMAESWLGLLGYTVQIYFDFGGYSNMAVGLGLVLGFTFPRNFRLPYTALSVTDFWRRWHMSLSAWLRDYLYIPLGGSRGTRLQTYRNLITVFLLCGLWHGASWNFVLWGMWHGSLLLVERTGLGRLLARLPIVARWAWTLLAVMGGWVLFRAHDLPEATQIFGGLLGRHGLDTISFDVHVALHGGAYLPLLAGCVLAVLPRLLRLPRTAPAIAIPVDAAWTLGLLILTMISVATGSYSPFLYFRF